MTFKKRRVEGLLTTTTTTLGEATSGGRNTFGRVVGIRARNWASSAKAGAGTDTAVKIKLTDANNDIFYLDASDRDYAAAEVTLAISGDDTATGLGVTQVDSTGAAATAGAGNNPVVEFPVQVIVLNGATATDYFTCDLLVEVS